MTFNKFIVASIIVGSISPIVSPRLWASGDDMIAKVAPYVYPANKSKGIPAMLYMPDGLSYLKLSSDGKTVGRYETSTAKLIETVLDVANTRTSSIDEIEGISLSADGKKLLVYTDSQPIYRHSFKAKYYVFEIRRNILAPVSVNHEYQQAPVISPDGRMVAFVADNNIIIKKLDYDNEVVVTTDGKKNAIINGVPDWTYEEEFATDCSMTWASDNSGLCYLKYNEENVPTYNFPLYEGDCGETREYALYPGTFSYKYPVAGETNSRVSVHYYNVENRTNRQITLNGRDIEYIPRILYAGVAERLMVVTLNRAQNKMELVAANPKSGVAKVIHTETSKTWIRPATYQKMEFGAETFVMQSNRSGYNHLYIYDYNGNQRRQITSGDWNVTDYYGSDARGFHYYQSTSSGPLNRVVSKIDANGKEVQLSVNEGWAVASFSPTKANYVINYSNATTPPNYILYDSKNKQVSSIENNDSLTEIAKTLPAKEFFSFTSDGVSLNGYIIKPEGFDSSKKYPVIMWQYSGPSSQEVVNRWKLDWDVVAAKNGFVVVCVDGRGTGGREASFEDVVYRRLGHYETIDQINAARYVASLPWVDADAIGIAGWSYGGYEALMAASAAGDNPFSAVVAIAPVTDWRYYDTVYGERFMLTPAENAENYEASAPINHIDNLKCPLLIMSGTADDNVHLSNTIEYVARLVGKRKSCDMMIFPNMNHSINDCGARAVVYGKMLEFFSQKLK